jgi:hypothetical protein
MKFCQVVPEICRGQVHVPKKERRIKRRIIITRFDCVWMQTQKSPNDPHIRIWACGCKFHHYQPIPHFKILLDIKFHWNRRLLTILRPMMDINSQHHNLLGNQISSQSEDFCILAAILDYSNGRHSKPTMDINSQHHNLLGNQISPKSEDFCILMAILDSKWPP